MIYAAAVSAIEASTGTVVCGVRVLRAENQNGALVEAIAIAKHDFPERKWHSHQADVVRVPPEVKDEL